MLMSKFQIQRFLFNCSGDYLGFKSFKKPLGDSNWQQFENFWYAILFFSLKLKVL